MNVCKHELKHNKDMDYIFCTLCGEKWEKPRTEYFPNPNQFPIYLSNSARTCGCDCHKGTLVWHSTMPCCPCVSMPSLTYNTGTGY